MRALQILMALLLVCAIGGCGNKGDLKKKPDNEEAVACNCD